MPDPRRIALAAALAAVVAIVVWRAVGGAAVAPPRGGSVGAVEAAHLGEADVAAAAVAAEREATAGAAGVFGTATDADGAPLAGWLVELTRLRFAAADVTEPAAPGWDDVAVRVAADGSFAFADVEPGHYEVGVNGSGSPTVFELTAGERRRVDLCLQDGSCAVTVELRRDGERLRGYHVTVDLASGTTCRAEAHDDLWRFLAPPGGHVLVVGARKGLPLSITGPDLSRRRYPTLAKLPFAVPAGRSSLELVVEVPMASLEVVASGGAGPIPLLRFVADGGPGSGYHETKQEVVAADGRTGTFAEIPPGTWVVRAQSRWFEAEPQTIRIPQGTATHRVVLDGRRLAVVRLDLRTPAGAPLRLRAAVRQYAERLPPLRSGDREVACGNVTAELVPRRDGVVLGFAGVPLGPAEWQVADGEVDGAVLFAMFDPVPAQRLDVLGAGDDALTVCVAPRAFVELIGCFKNGMESPFVRLRVFAGDRPVAGLAEVAASRWQGFLPPGEYRVEITDGQRETRREHVLFVQRRDVALRLRP